ncbi:hypothetical protein FACS1894137_13830 [Spirochaetia bacterium]|nr:hypothetical protein FACS1894137_13830 [Spirochaetia bacterium]
MMSDDVLEWDDSIEKEDNPFNDPDMTFYSIDTAEKNGAREGYNDAKSGDFNNLKNMEFPFDADDEAIEAYKEAYSKAYNKYFDDELEAMG